MRHTLRHSTMKATIERTPQTELKIEMLRRGISRGDLSKLSGVPYVTVSGILTGRVTQPANYEKIRAAIESTALAGDAEDDITPEEFRSQIHEVAGRPGRIKMQLPSLTKA